MRTMTDHRIDERAQAVREADARSTDTGAELRQTRSHEEGAQMESTQQKSAQKVIQPARRRRNRSIGRKAVLMYKINERLIGMDNNRLQIMLVYACMQRAAQAIQRLKKFEPKMESKKAK